MLLWNGLIYCANTEGGTMTIAAIQEVLPFLQAMEENSDGSGRRILVRN